MIGELRQYGGKYASGWHTKISADGRVYPAAPYDQPAVLEIAALVIGRYLCHIIVISYVAQKAFGTSLTLGQLKIQYKPRFGVKLKNDR